MHHKNAIKKQKRSFLNAEKANKKQKKSTNKLLKQIKKPRFQTINTLFSRYNRNFYQKHSNYG